MAENDTRTFTEAQHFALLTDAVALQTASPVLVPPLTQALATAGTSLKVDGRADHEDDGRDVLPQRAFRRRTGATTGMTVVITTVDATIAAVGTTPVSASRTTSAAPTVTASSVAPIGVPSEPCLRTSGR